VLVEEEDVDVEAGAAAEVLLDSVFVVLVSLDLVESLAVLEGSLEADFDPRLSFL
jgi:hypothetical protein